MAKYKSGWMEFEEASYLSEVFQQIVTDCKVGASSSHFCIEFSRNGISHNKKQSNTRNLDVRIEVIHWIFVHLPSASAVRPGKGVKSVGNSDHRIALVGNISSLIF